jgi:hypothetical protein
MAVNLTCTIANGVIGPSPYENGMVSEDFTITGSSAADGDTGTYTPQYLNPDRVIVGGNLEYSISSGVITVKATAAIDDNNVIAAKAIGYVT